MLQFKRICSLHALTGMGKDIFTVSVRTQNYHLDNTDIL